MLGVPFGTPIRLSKKAGLPQAKEGIQSLDKTKRNIFSI